MIEILSRLLSRQAGESAVKCFSEGHNRMVRIGFEPRPCGSQHGSLTTRHVKLNILIHVGFLSRSMHSNYLYQKWLTRLD